MAESGKKNDVSELLPKRFQNEAYIGQRHPLWEANGFNGFRDWMISVEERFREDRVLILTLQTNIERLWGRIAELEGK